MISSIYVDNYRCFSEFVYTPGRFDLLLGENGSGRSSVFEVLEALQSVVVSGVSTETAFPEGTRSRWGDQSVQTFRLGMVREGSQYEYTLVIEHDPTRVKNRIKIESLTFQDQPLYKYDGAESHLFRDNGTAGPVFPFDWTRSAVATIPERNDNQKLTWFRSRLRDLLVLSPDPPAMDAVSRKEVSRPDRTLSDLVSWLRHAQQVSVDVGSGVRDSLRDALFGFATYGLDPVGGGSMELNLRFEFRDEATDRLLREFRLPFDFLSDGQRNLFALYTILHAAIRKDAIVCIDEPDNFIASREVQPWLSQLQTRAEELGCQCLMISHHPEQINYLAVEHGTLFFRDVAGAARTKKFEWDGEGGFSPAELVARGWAE